MTPSDERPQIGDKVRSRSMGNIGIVCEPPLKRSLSVPDDAVWAIWDDSQGRPMWSRNVTILERAKPDYTEEDWI